MCVCECTCVCFRENLCEREKTKIMFDELNTSLEKRNFKDLKIVNLTVKLTKLNLSITDKERRCNIFVITGT